jgi:hypothetical protein
VRSALRVLTCGVLIGACVALVSVSARADDTLTADGGTDGVQVGVKALKRNDGDTVTLRFQIINKSDAQFDLNNGIRDPNAHDGYGVVSGVYLLDQANKKKYLVVRDADGNCVCATMAAVEKGKTENLWATYPAPPADTQKVTVVVPTFEPIDGVPITANQ